MVRKLSRASTMSTSACIRSLGLVLAAACSRPDAVPAQLESPAARFAKSQEPAVRIAASMLESGRPWRATEIIDSAYRGSQSRSPEVMLFSATAAASWGGWSRVERDLATAPWLDSLFDGAGRELLARAALARGADSAARVHADRALSQSRIESDRAVREVLLARALDRQALGDSGMGSREIYMEERSEVIRCLF